MDSVESKKVILRSIEGDVVEFEAEFRMLSKMLALTNEDEEVQTEM